jgi:hypothetical protein
VLELRRLPRRHAAVEAMRIPVRVLLCVLETYLELDNDMDNGLHMYCFTWFHAIDQAILCSLIYNKNLACGVV